MTSSTATLRSSLAAALNWADLVGLDVSSVSVDVAGRVELYAFGADPVRAHDVCLRDGFTLSRSAHEGTGMVGYERGDRWRDRDNFVCVTVAAADALNRHRG